jgi:hypothetical protein
MERNRRERAHCRRLNSVVTAFAPGLPPNPGVSLRRPTFAKTITYTPHSTATIVHSTIDIGNRVGICRGAKVFMPPGTNYSVRVQLGFNGQRMIPTESADDYIIGSGIVHEFPWGIQVQKLIDVWAWCWNGNAHTIQVTLDIDYEPFIPPKRAVVRIEI